MSDPRLELTAQDLAYAARSLRVLARQAEQQAADPTFHASREVSLDATKAYDELARKYDRIAEAVSKASSQNPQITAPIRRRS